MKAAPWFILGVPAILAIAALPARAATTQVIYSFAGGVDGEYTDTDVAMDGAGNLYGTSVQGGTHASGAPGPQARGLRLGQRPRVQHAVDWRQDELPPAGLVRHRRSAQARTGIGVPQHFSSCCVQRDKMRPPW